MTELGEHIPTAEETSDVTPKSETKVLSPTDLIDREEAGKLLGSYFNVSKAIELNNWLDEIFSKHGTDVPGKDGSDSVTRILRSVIYNIQDITRRPRSVDPRLNKAKGPINGLSPKNTQD